MKKPEIKKLDKMWREAVKERDGGCQICGRVDYMNAHHVIGRRNQQTRWDLDNGIGLCPKHHTFGTESAHQDPAWFMEWFQANYPERYANIMKQRIMSVKRNYDDVVSQLNG
jgi:hypothetical protein